MPPFRRDMRLPVREDAAHARNGSFSTIPVSQLSDAHHPTADVRSEQSEQASHDQADGRFCIIAPNNYRATGKIRSGLRIISMLEGGIGRPVSAHQEAEIPAEDSQFTVACPSRFLVSYRPFPGAATGFRSCAPGRTGQVQARALY